MRRILIDADTGIDDSVALLYALASPELRVEGVTTCFGNSGAAQSADNCLRLIRLARCGYEVPVAVGAECALDGGRDRAPVHIHGENGIGNVVLPESEQRPLDMDAADFILRKARELDGELTVVTTGRLTNLARAFQRDPGLPRRLRRVVSMGGCLNVPGNISPVAEANLYGDPRAADLVLRGGFPLILVGLDVTTRTFITEENLREAEAHCSERRRAALAYMREAMKLYFEFHRRTEGMAGRCFVHDPLAMLIAEDPSLGEYKMLRVGVEHEAPAFRGMLLTDGRFQSGMDHDEVSVCVRVDSDRAVRRLFSAFR